MFERIDPEFMKEESQTVLISPDVQMTVLEASRWASSFTGRRITSANIQYLINYGRVRTISDSGRIMIRLSELQRYYQSRLNTEQSYKSKLGPDLNWTLSFDQYRESERTKHVHRLHPYKGKFIPQLIEYFLDDHVDEFKNDIWFKPGDVVLDPFCGSGTTLVQANELSIHAIGIDVSEFNAWMSNVKLTSFDLAAVASIGVQINHKLKESIHATPEYVLETEFNTWLSEFNRAHFPSAEFKRQIRHRTIDEESHVSRRLPIVVERYWNLIKELNIDITPSSNGTFLNRWYLPTVKRQIEYISNTIEGISAPTSSDALKIILSRTARTCRATTHADLATLQTPIWEPYYCRKHGKICKPLLSITGWWDRYLKDTIRRLQIFAGIRTNTTQHCLVGDARRIEILDQLLEDKPDLAQTVSSRKVRGIFTSPPYVGLIDYHQQHAYAYELLDFKRRDELELGSLSDGQSRAAKDAYARGISKVLMNCRPILDDDADIFLVANDRHGLFSKIAEFASLKIVNTFHRPVLNRTEKDRSAYSETIFHMKAV